MGGLSQKSGFKRNACELPLCVLWNSGWQLAAIDNDRPTTLSSRDWYRRLTKDKLFNWKKFSSLPSLSCRGFHFCPLFCQHETIPTWPIAVIINLIPKVSRPLSPALSFLIIILKELLLLSFGLHHGNNTIFQWIKLVSWDFQHQKTGS